MSSSPRSRRPWLVATAPCLLALAAAWASTPAHASPDDPPLQIRRAAGAITIDGDLSDPGWQGAQPITTWFETNVTDNTEPPVANVGWLAYDDRFLYAAMDFADPNPAAIRAPYVDRDNVGSPTDYGGIIVDTRNDHRTAILFLANPRGIQYDATSDDASGEDNSPDFFWDSAAKITATGWRLEIRIPFSSLRYSPADPQTWGLMFYRNYPRDYRYQFFTSHQPRSSNCFICNAARLEGLSGLPSGGHYTVAPYVSGRRSGAAEDGLGAPLAYDDPQAEVGVDAKWLPSPDHAFDATINPDFSQIESDAAQISANERFALFFPEKRPFFLEGVDLLSTPLQAVYTRTITHPDWGARGTGKLGDTAYTVLVTKDSGDGSVIIPGPLGSDFADQDFASTVAIGRVRHDLAAGSFISFLATDREVEDDGGGGHNRVFGPDFRWQASGSDTVTGQLLLSRSLTPERPDLAAEWDGRSLDGSAARLSWSHGTQTWDWFLQGLHYSDDFRADVGFIPQVGFREGYGEVGYTFRPQGFVRRLRLYDINTYDQDTDGNLIYRELSAGFGLDARWSSFVRMRWSAEAFRVGDQILTRDRLVFEANAVPGRRWSAVAIEGFVGSDIDFAGAREGDGGSVALSTTLRPSDHLEVNGNWNRRWLDLDAGRLFTADVQRLKTTYTFSSRMFLRGIVQHVATERDPALYLFEVDRKTGGVDTSLLFSYKLNWQTVLFVGLGDSRALDERDDLEVEGREIFLKVSYAFQR
jgi:hypothetical protein